MMSIGVIEALSTASTITAADGRIRRFYPRNGRTVTFPDGRNRPADAQPIRCRPATILMQVNVHQAGSVTVLRPTGRDWYTRLIYEAGCADTMVRLK
jgi:hypothetical protein